MYETREKIIKQMLDNISIDDLEPAKQSEWTTDVFYRHFSYTFPEPYAIQAIVQNGVWKQSCGALVEIHGHFRVDPNDHSKILPCSYRSTGYEVRFDKIKLKLQEDSDKLYGFTPYQVSLDFTNSIDYKYAHVPAKKAEQNRGPLLDIVGNEIEFDDLVVITPPNSRDLSVGKIAKVKNKTVDVRILWGRRRNSTVQVDLSRVLVVRDDNLEIKLMENILSE